MFVECWQVKDILYPGILNVTCWEIETLPCEGLSWHGYTILNSHHNPIQSVSREIGFLLKASYYNCQAQVKLQLLKTQLARRGENSYMQRFSNYFNYSFNAEFDGKTQLDSGLVEKIKMGALRVSSGAHLWLCLDGNGSFAYSMVNNRKSGRIKHSH